MSGKIGRAKLGHGKSGMGKGGKGIFQKIEKNKKLKIYIKNACLDAFLRVRFCLFEFLF